MVHQQLANTIDHITINSELMQQGIHSCHSNELNQRSLSETNDNELNLSKIDLKIFTTLIANEFQCTK